MAGSMKVARDPLAQLRLLLTVFALGIAIGRSRNRDLDRTVFLCTALAAKIALWFAERAADGGRLLRVRCLVLLLDVGLSAAICYLFLEPVAGDIIACYKLGCDVSVALEAAVVVVVVVSVVVALAVGLHLLDAN